MSKMLPKMDPDALERQLRSDLEAIQKYREVVARYGGEAPDVVPPALHEAKPRKKEPRPRNSVIGLIEASLGDAWHPVAFYLERVRATKPRTIRNVVRNTLERLANDDVAERRGDKASGVEYRRKPGSQHPPERTKAP